MQRPYPNHPPMGQCLACGHYTLTEDLFVSVDQGLTWRIRRVTKCFKRLLQPGRCCSPRRREVAALVA